MKTRLIPLLALSVTLACGRAESASGDPARKVRDLIAATTPYAPTAGPAEQTTWIDRRRRMVDLARAGGSEVGREALRSFRELDGLPFPVQAALLDAAAHAAPQETAPVLEELVVNYGADLALRAEAARALGVAAPGRALEVLEPLLLDPLPDQTRPPAEALLEALLVAAEPLDHDLSRTLVDVATEIYQPDDVRHRAVKELGRHSGPRVEAALRQVLVESTGNAYIRRLATRSLLDVYEADRACEVLLEVYEHEADTRFLAFLADAIEKNCR